MRSNFSRLTNLILKFAAQFTLAPATPQFVLSFLSHFYVNHVLSSAVQFTLAPADLFSTEYRIKIVEHLNGVTCKRHNLRLNKNLTINNSSLL